VLQQMSERDGAETTKEATAAIAAIKKNKNI
jgi:hypothetical protein